jgi:hypothetical protein
MMHLIHKEVHQQAPDCYLFKLWFYDDEANWVVYKEKTWTQIEKEVETKIKELQK